MRFLLEIITDSLNRRFEEAVACHRRISITAVRDENLGTEHTSDSAETAQYLTVDWKGFLSIFFGYLMALHITENLKPEILLFRRFGFNITTAGSLI
jgi:hypothetical protein